MGTQFLIMGITCVNLSKPPERNLHTLIFHRARLKSLFVGGYWLYYNEPRGV